MNENTPVLRKRLITNSIFVLKDAISFDEFFKLEALYYITKDGDDKKVLAINSEGIWATKAIVREEIMNENTPALRKQLITNSIYILKDAISFDEFFKLEALYYITKDGDDKKVLEINSEDIWSRSNLMEAVLTLYSSTPEIKLEHSEQDSNMIGISDQPSCSNMSNADEMNQHVKDTTPQLEDISMTEIKLEPHEQKESNSSKVDDQQPGCSNMSNATGAKNQHAKDSTHHHRSMDKLVSDEDSGEDFAAADGLAVDLTRHQKTHVLKCDHCQQEFMNRAVLTKHMEVHMDGYRDCYKCRFCFKMISKRRRLVKHEAGHAEMGNSKSLARGKNTKSHGQVHSKQRFHCKICDKSFAWSQTLKLHIRTVHFGEKRFTCNICNKWFYLSGHLKTHMRTHTGERPFKCQICEKTFTLTGNLQMHIRTIHVGEKLFTCNICDKSFAESGNLKKHMRTHTGERPFKCQICEKTFTQTGNLQQHIRTLHVGEKRFTCNICDKSFTQSGTLKTHMRTHTGERPFKCQICEKTFTQTGNLQQHIRTLHVGEKRFTCNICDKSFTQSGTLKSHMRTHTSEIRIACKVLPG